MRRKTCFREEVCISMPTRLSKQHHPSKPIPTPKICGLILLSNWRPISRVFGVTATLSLDLASRVDPLCQRRSFRGQEQTLLYLGRLVCLSETCLRKRKKEKNRPGFRTMRIPIAFCSPAGREYLSGMLCIISNYQAPRPLPYWRALWIFGSFLWTAGVDGRIVSRVLSCW